MELEDYIQNIYMVSLREVAKLLNKIYYLIDREDFVTEDSERWNQRN
jgi:hypothetical protein